MSKHSFKLHLVAAALITVGTVGLAHAHAVPSQSETERDPNPALTLLMDKAVAQGADIVSCTHNECVSLITNLPISKGQESLYQDGLYIVYPEETADKALLAQIQLTVHPTLKRRK